MLVAYEDTLLNLTQKVGTNMVGSFHALYDLVDI